MPIKLTADQQRLRDVGRALKEETDGKALRRDLLKSLKSVMDSTKQEAHSNLMSISSAGLTGGAPLRTAVASQMKTEARLSGNRTGVGLRVRRKAMPRGFANAPKALNTPKGWRHRVYGRDVWVDQVAVPNEWFDRAARAHREQAHEGVLQAMQDMAARIAARAK